MARKRSDATARLYVSEHCLAHVGELRTTDALSRSDFIGFDDNGRYVEGLNLLGLNVTAKSFPVLTASHLVHWELVKQGVGVGVMVEETGDAEPPGAPCRVLA